MCSLSPLADSVAPFPIVQDSRAQKGVLWAEPRYVCPQRQCILSLGVSRDGKQWFPSVFFSFFLSLFVSFFQGNEFGYQVFLGWQDLFIFFVPIFSEALITTYSLSLRAPFFLEADHSLNHSTEEMELCTRAPENIAPEIVHYISAMLCHRTRNCSR